MQSSPLDRAIKLALIAHEGQLDWSLRPFILHPMRVGMSLLEKYDEHHACVGVLHDAVEDSAGKVTVGTIQRALGPIVANDVAILTRAVEPYDEYLQAVMLNKVASRVKLADLADNLSPFRLMVGTNEHEESFLRHGRALHRIRDRITMMGWE